MDDFNGKTAVITGGASGIGLAIAQELAAAGCNLVLADVDQVRLDATVADFSAAGHSAIGVITDVSDAAAVDRLADAAWDGFGGTHLLFNNAGAVVFGSALDISRFDWKWAVDVNLWGVINGVTAFLPRLIAQGQPAHIVNTSSFAGLVPPASNIAYNVTKAAVVSLSETLRLDVAAHGIGVSVLCPMQVATRIWDSSSETRPTGEGAFKRPSAELLAGIAGGVMDAPYVARYTLDAIRRNALYVLPNDDAFEALDAKHAEYRALA